MGWRFGICKITEAFFDILGKRNNGINSLKTLAMRKKICTFVVINQAERYSMEKLIIQDKDYVTWITSLCSRYRQSQIKAAVKVNSEKLMFYWSLGKDIVELHAESK